MKDDDIDKWRHADKIILTNDKVGDKYTTKLELKGSGWKTQNAEWKEDKWFLAKYYDGSDYKGKMKFESKKLLKEERPFGKVCTQEWNFKKNAIQIIYKCKDTNCSNEIEATLKFRRIKKASSSGSGSGGGGASASAGFNLGFSFGGKGNGGGGR